MIQLRLLAAASITLLAPGFSSLARLSAQTAGSVDSAVTWNTKAAASYLDTRAEWWTTWPNAARDHNTFCVSCHTALPYMLARPALRTPLGEHGLSAVERKIVDNVAQRVFIWSDAQPFYNDAGSGAGKSAESRSIESVLNALILTTYAREDPSLTPTAQEALDNMLALQWTTGENKGAWLWLQFHNEPWEGDDSGYWGQTLAALALARAPAAYPAQPAVKEKEEALLTFLRTREPGEIPLNRLAALWAAAEIPELLPPSEKSAIREAILALQKEDGGWSTSALINPKWKRRDQTPLETRSDGYATGLVTMILQKDGLPRTDAHLQKAFAWFSKNQDPTEGFWPAYSVNKERDLKTDRGRFMSDAATAYAVLALTAH